MPYFVSSSGQQSKDSSLAETLSLEPHGIETNASGPLHVLDLPALYKKPSASTLLSILSRLVVIPTSFSPGSLPDASGDNATKVDESGIPRYLTSIISSPLSWIKDDSIKEEIWEGASRRLAERAGRNATPSLIRTIKLPASNLSPVEKTIFLHELSLTEDNLGHKTWSSSYMLSLLLPRLAHLLPASAQSDSNQEKNRILELGSGTGLFGISFAALFPNSDVELTDLPEIVGNLARNVEANAHLLIDKRSKITAKELDWGSCADLQSLPSISSPDPPSTTVYGTILAADPIYSPAHPCLLTRAVNAHLSRSSEARFVLGLPIREAYLPQLDELWSLLRSIGLETMDEGEETCVDDWIDALGNPVEVRVKWAVWRWMKGEVRDEGQDCRTFKG